MKILLILALAVVLLISGCVTGEHILVNQTSQQSPEAEEQGQQNLTIVVDRVKYVCPDDSIVDDPEECPKYEVQNLIVPYCGDGICQEDENCTGCAEDCGECPLPCPEIDRLELNIEGNLRVTVNLFGNWSIQTTGRDNMYHDGSMWVVVCDKGAVERYRYCRIKLNEKDRTILTGRSQVVTVVHERGTRKYIETICG